MKNNIQTARFLKQDNLINSVLGNIQVTETHLDLINVLAYIAQKMLKIDNETPTLFNYVYLNDLDYKIKLSVLEELASIKKRTNDFTFNKLKEIRDMSTKVENFRTAEGDLLSKTTISIIDRVSTIESVGKETYVIVRFSKEFLLLTLDEYNKKYGRFTILTLQNTISLNSKHAKRLYEYLLTKHKWKGKRGYSKSFTLSLEAVQTIFNFENNTPFSYSVRQLDRVHKNINKLIPFSYEANKKDNKITFLLHD